MAHGQCIVCKVTLPDGSQVCADCFSLLKSVRVSSLCGPCLAHYRMVRENKATFTVAFRNGSGYSIKRFEKSAVHEIPCPSCTDHPHTFYPEGYQD